jgi:hypothetical protein
MDHYIGMVARLHTLGDILAILPAPADGGPTKRIVLHWAELGILKSVGGKGRGNWREFGRRELYIAVVAAELWQWGINTDAIHQVVASLRNHMEQTPSGNVIEQALEQLRTGKPFDAELGLVRYGQWFALLTEPLHIEKHTGAILRLPLAPLFARLGDDLR